MLPREAAVGGLIGLLIDGDPITIDAENNLLTLDLRENEISRRLTSMAEPGTQKKKEGYLPSMPNW